MPPPAFLLSQESKKGDTLARCCGVMAEQLDLLKQLQTIDGELYRLRKQQREKPKELEQVATQVAQQEARLKVSTERLNALQLSQKEKEMDLQTREANAKKLQGQLFQVKTNKEYTALQHEIDTLKADASALEETILKTFDTIEGAAKNKQGEQERLAQEQEQLRTTRERIERELAAIGEQMAQLDRRREVLAPTVPAPTLLTYERILNIRDGLALVPLVEESCGGCHRRLPPQVVNEIYLKANLVMCESCSRILYFDEARSER